MEMLSQLLATITTAAMVLIGICASQGGCSWWWLAVPLPVVILLMFVVYGLACLPLMVRAWRQGRRRG
jgi:hypothetical protein